MLDQKYLEQSCLKAVDDHGDGGDLLERKEEVGGRDDGGDLLE